MSQVGYGLEDTIGFYGKTPIAQYGVITTVTTGETVMAAAINSIVALLRSIGLTASP